MFPFIFQMILLKKFQYQFFEHNFNLIKTFFRNITPIWLEQSQETSNISPY